MKERVRVDIRVPITVALGPGGATVATTHAEYLRAVEVALNAALRGLPDGTRRRLADGEIEAEVHTTHILGGKTR